MQDTVMYFAYVSPQGSTIYNNLNEKNGIVLLESNIADVKFRYPDSYFFLAGDLNARIKDFRLTLYQMTIFNMFLGKQIMNPMILI